MRKLFTHDQEQYIINNYKTQRYVDIADTLHVTERQVRAWVNSHGLRKTRVFDTRYFQCIDTPEKSYWLGMLYADGWIRSDTTTRNYEVGIELDDTDAYLLDKLNKAIGGVHKVTFRTREKEIYGYKVTTHTSVLRFYSLHMVSDLISHGIVQNKTQSNIFPMPSLYFWDFTRGYLDGDGCIYISKRGYVQVSFTASQPHVLEYLRGTFASFNIASAVYQEKENKYRLYVNGFNAMNLLGYIYNTGCNLMLDRKHEIYKLAVLSRNATNNQRTKSANAMAANAEVTQPDCERPVSTVTHSG